MKHLNIFQKRKKQTQPIIIIDYREKNSLVASELMLLGLKIIFKELKVADYLVKNTAIERKTVSDFLSSMTNKRLLRQLEELQQYPNKLLIIEGIEEQELYNDIEAGKNTSIHPNAIRGFLLSILLKYKIPIIFTKNYGDTAKFLYVLSKKQKENKLSIRPNKKSLNKKERIQYILEGFPGIGPKTSKKLIKKFKSLKNTINASEEELKEILGKKAEIFKKIIDAEI